MEYDLKCILECKYNDNLNSSFILKNIHGSQKKKLLGSDVYEMDLNLFFSDNFRQIHNNFMIDILINRNNSKFWDLFIDGKMNRIVNIINPITKYEYSVKLNIIFNSQDKNKVIFDVIFTDVSIVNKIINNTGLLTHDLRSIIKSAQNIVSLIENESSSCLQTKQENFTTLKELLNEAFEMCSKSRTKLMIENINIIKHIVHIKIYLEISKYLKKIKNIFPNIKFNFVIKSNISIKSIENDTLWHLFLNIIKNAINANSTEISIKVDKNDDNNELLLYISDNGCGMTEAKKLNFFSRKLPEKIQDDDKIDSNRGEGFLLSFYEWINLGGTVDILNNELNNNTEFLIKIKGIQENDFFLLSKEHLNLIQNILNETNKKKILLIDDCLLNLKIMSLKIIRSIVPDYKHFNFPILTPEQWQNIGIIKIDTDTHIFILLSNGMYGKEISMIIEPSIIITDIQMPELNGIQMIKLLLEYGIKSKILINSSYSYKDNDEIIELVQKYNIKFIEKGVDFSFIENLFNTN